MEKDETWEQIHTLNKFSSPSYDRKRVLGCDCNRSGIFPKCVQASVMKGNGMGYYGKGSVSARALPLMHVIALPAWEPGYCEVYAFH
jgi:hypothetical protein